MQLSINHPVIW